MGGETWLEGTTTPSLPVPNDTTQRLASGNLLVRKMDVGLTNRCKRRRSAAPNVGNFHNFVQPLHSLVFTFGGAPELRRYTSTDLRARRQLDRIILSGLI